jgi:hypothetical protein
LTCDAPNQEIARPRQPSTGEATLKKRQALDASLSSQNKISTSTTMKNKLKNLVMLAAIGGLSLAASGTAQAQLPLLEKVQITSVMLIQGNTSTNRAGTKITTAVPDRLPTISTAYLLKQLAIDAPFTLSAGDKLSFNGTGFEVDDATNGLVADVSDILTLTTNEQVELISGSSTTNGATVQPFSQTDYSIVTVAYFGSTTALSFQVTGVGAIATTVPAANKKGKFTETGSISIQDGTGGGTITPTTGADTGVATPFLLTGFTLTGGGSRAEDNSD